MSQNRRNITGSKKEKEKKKLEKKKKRVCNLVGERTLKIGGVVDRWHKKKEKRGGEKKKEKLTQTWKKGGGGGRKKEREEKIKPPDPRKLKTRKKNRGFWEGGKERV